MHNTKMMYRFMQQADKPTQIYIYDDITAQGPFNWEAWKYEESETSANHFVKLLAEIPDGSSIELHINSYGGDVKEGIAIYNLLKQKVCEKICYIDCFAYSVAYVIAMACDKIIMGLGSSIMIHEMWTCVAGNADELRKQADDLDILMESNRQIFLARSNINEQQLVEMMKAETIIGPQKCLEYGFCDEISETAMVEQEQINQSYERKFLQMRQDMLKQKTLLQYSKEFVEAKPQPSNEAAQQQNTENKSLKMMSDFFNAFLSMKNNLMEED